MIETEGQRWQRVEDEARAKGGLPPRCKEWTMHEERDGDVVRCQLSVCHEGDHVDGGVRW